MKILLYTDVHFSSTSSVVNMRKNKFTTRLELLINSMNWVQELGDQHNCNLQVCLGDFCDRSNLNDEEISAINEIKWNDEPKYFIIGNHESAQHDLRFSTVNILKNACNNLHVIDSPTRLDFYGTGTNFYFIPYIVESDRKSLAEEIAAMDNKVFSKDKAAKTIIFSHNDIAGCNYAGFISKIGFSIEEIETQKCLFLNGHLHNQQFVTKNIINLGSLSAHNFTNDSYNYKYGAWILDTDTMQLTFFENPFSLNFYKLEVKTAADLQKLAVVKNNSAVSIKSTVALLQDVKDTIASQGSKILYNRLTTFIEENAPEEIKIQELRTNHLGRLVEFCKAVIPNSEMLDEELSEICK